MANPFTVQPLGGIQGINQINQGMQNISNTSQANQAEEQRRAVMSQAQDVLSRGDPQEIAQFSLQNPDIGRQIQGSVQFKNDATRQNMMQGMQQIIAGGNPEQILNQRAQFVESQGGDATQTRQEIEVLRADPEGYIRQVENSYALMDPEGFTAFREARGGPGGPDFGKVQPGDFTPASLQTYGQSGDFNDLVRYESSKSVNIGGVPHVFDPSRGQFVPASVSGGGMSSPVTAQTVAGSEATIAGATEGARLGAQLQIKPAVEAAVTTARATAQNQAAAASPEAQQAERVKIANADDTISQVDNLIGNDDFLNSLTGVRGKLIPIPGTPGFDADVAFNQFKDSLTLENLSKMTGILTDRDIQLLSSAASGLERGMSRTAMDSRLKTIRGVLSGKSADARAKLEKMTGGSSQQSAGIMNMSNNQLQSLNPADLSDEELQQAADRFNQLGGQ